MAFWFITADLCGMACAILTYFVVMIVGMGFVRIGIWEGLVEFEPLAWLNLALFKGYCIMIYWSHFKCMTSEPGLLPKNYTEKIKYDKLPLGIQSII